MRTVTVTEWVPEQYESCRTVYKTEYVNETYTAYRTECVPETRTRMVTVSRMVPECRDVVRTTYKCVPTQETRTCTKQVWTCKPVTTIHRKCVDQGHWECCEVPCEPGFFSRLGSHRRHGCDDPCAPACCEVKTKTVKKWVPNKVWIETPVTKMVRTCEYVPYTTCVTVNKMVPVQEVHKVTVNRCVTEQQCQTYTVNVARQVPYQATRCVAKCVPVQEKVTCCRMVPRQVQKCVPVCEPCEPACDACETGHRGFFGRRHSGCCH
jgi:hypothetical protein